MPLSFSSIDHRITSSLHLLPFLLKVFFFFGGGGGEGGGGVGVAFGTQLWQTLAWKYVTFILNL